MRVWCLARGLRPVKPASAQPRLAVPLGPPSPFFVSVHSEDIKVTCFYRFAEVFILKDLTARICTKIVQVS
jgi:hypothetical protein